MKRNCLTFIFSIPALLFVINFSSCKKDDPIDFNPTNIVDTTYVHIRHGKLRDTTGTELELKSVNLGGWLLWESWIWGGGFNSETWMMNTIESRTSSAFAQDFRESIYTNFITRDDIMAVHDLGFNSIRVPFNHAFFDNGSNDNALDEAHFQIIDNLLDWCEEFNVYVILDMHAAPGGQNPLFISDPDNVKVWASEDNKQQMLRIWKAIAERYKDRRIVLGYDILNEPSPPDNMDMVNLYTTIIAGIREVDTHHLLILEGADFAKDFSIFNSLMDNNQIYSFHFYTWFMSEPDQNSQLQSFSDFGTHVNAPLWCGEWGEASPSDLQNIKLKLRDSQYNFCGDAYWTWKKVKVGSASYPLNEIHVSDQWTKMIKNEPKTSSETYEEIAQSFLDAVLISNTTQDGSVAAALQ